MSFLKAMFDGEYGLVASNLRVYFKCRTAGSDHRDALAVMFATRYRAEPERRLYFLEMLHREDRSNDPESDLRSFISLMHGEETVRIPDFEDVMRLDLYMDELVAINRRKYPGVL